MNQPDLNVLIVEDDDFQRDIFGNMLRTLGVASIQNASNGKQALEILRAPGTTPIDVALCDLNMPEMDGMEFMRHLGQEYSDVAVIITTSLDGKLLSSVDRMTRMYGIRLLGAVEKPIILTQLQELLSKLDSTEPGPVRPGLRAFVLQEILQGIQEKQFEAYFQPKVELKSGRLIGAEALARWIHPEHGVVPPDAFIPQLEQSGNLDELTFLMLERAAVACKALHDKGHLLTISVNLSLRSLDDTTLADRITHVARQAGIEPQYIVLEITESAAMTDIAHALENLARLCMNGFALSIDDYGTGYSSLQQLTRIAFSELKIDKSFVKDFASNQALRIVVESSVDMAHKLKVKSVAEGVEHRSDWDLLAQIGCDTAQGYYIAKPMNSKMFDEYITKHDPHAFATVPRPAHTTAPQRDKLKILVVDDDDFTRRIVLRVLHDSGYTSLVDADSGEAALRLLESSSFDLVITDVNMEGINGLRLVQLIRSGKTYAKPETRIVVLTSFSQTEVLGTALALDINGFLVKPVIPAIVEEKLNRAMTERLHLHSSIAYETVRTELTSLDGFRRTASRCGAGIALDNATEAGKTEGEVHKMALRWLRPGMILKENVYFKDGALLLSAGHTLSELSINRLHDLEVLLPSNGISVQGAPETH